MTSRETRRAFLDFFADKGHRVVPSSPLVLPSDPTLLFANAGMNQFKDVFTGRESRDYVRAASSQKCLRVSGKHNDLEQVGRTPRHHTFFEMLGNFSFGDYFKEEAIDWAWELVTGVYGLPADRLWATVFGGSEAAAADDEALAIWRDRVGIDPARILRLGEKDNFWRMGDTGPCGPCSELHYDLGEDLRSVEGASTPETDEPRFIEIWNLVFMQFEQGEDGDLRPLPAPSIDTGMGLERIASVLQGKRSNYESDLFVPILEAIGDAAGVRPGADPEGDVSLRVIADHARALCFLTADGVVPANDKRGYVLRRILRRAIRHGRKLGIEGPFLERVTPVVIESLGEDYPEIVAAREAILEVGRREEHRFAETLTTGLERLEQTMSALPEGGKGAVVPGEDIFRLYDTFGLPLDLAQDIVEERGATIDLEGFEREMAGQRSRAQAAWKGSRTDEVSESYGDLAAEHPTRFEGYRTTRLEGVPVVAALRDGVPVERLGEGEEGQVFLEASPFYGEAGGQVGDTGSIATRSGRARVVDTLRPADGLLAHRVVVESGEIAVGDTAEAEVDRRRRDAIRRNHTATHLLHAALREVVGTHVKQAGSLVAADRLRFDFAHFAGLNERAIGDIEDLVNRKIFEDLPVRTELEDLDAAVRAGAMALFGEKYGDEVRVVSIGDFSRELCGGTHCSRTGEIGLLKLTQERGIAAGVRRIEATTGQASLDGYRRSAAILGRLEEILSVPREEVVAEVERRLEQARSAARELERHRVRDVRERLAKLAESPQVIQGIRVLAARADGLAAKEVREVADALRGKLGSGVVVLGRAEGTKAALVVAVTEDLTHRVPAGDLVRDLARVVGGGGGGRRDLAEAGGKEPDRLDEALRAVGEAVTRRLGAAD